MLQALLAYLLAACGEERERRDPGARAARGFPPIPADELEEHLSLLNLVNFGGGCYTVYAELRGDTVYVDKELWGDTFRAAPRLTPLEARAIRLALEYVGPMIAAEAHYPARRVRKKLEETFGAVRARADARAARRHRGGRPRLDARARMRERRIVEIEYQKEADAGRRPASSSRTPRARAPELVRPHVGPDQRRARSFRLDRMRSAKARPT